MINPSTSPLICSVRYSFTELINLNVYFCDFSTWTRPHNVPSLAIHANTVWVKKNPPLKFSDIFPKLFGIFSPNFTCLLHVPVYAGLQIFIWLPAALTKLRHIKCDHQSTIICSKCPSSTETHAGWSHLVRHNVVTVGDNWIKNCVLA